MSVHSTPLSTCSLKSTLPLDTAVEGDVVVHHEIAHDSGPGAVGGHGVPLRGQGLDPWQQAARHLWKIVVLVVIANIIGQVVERTVVGVGLLALDELKVLRDKVTRQGVQAHAQ